MPLSNWIKLTVPTLAAIAVLYGLANSTPTEIISSPDKPVQVRTIDEASLEQRTRREPDYITFDQPIASWDDELPPRIKRHYDEYIKNSFMRKKISHADKKYGALIDLYSEGYNLPRDLYLATIMVESGGNSKLTSKAGAKGLLQLMPDTAKNIEKISGLDCDDLYDAQTSLTCGAFYLSWINEKMENSFPDLSVGDKWDLTLAGYNRGHNGIAKKMKKIKAESFLGLPKLNTTPQDLEYVSKIRAIERIVQEDRRDAFKLVNFKSWPYSGFR